MLGDREHDLAPVFVSVHVVYLLERFVHVRNRGDQRRSLPDRSANRFPVEWVSPAVLFVPGTPCLLQNIQEVNRSLVMLLLLSNLGEQGESHCVMRIGDWKALRFPKQRSGRGNEGLTK